MISLRELAENKRLGKRIDGPLKCYYTKPRRKCEREPSRRSGHIQRAVLEDSFIGLRGLFSGE